MEGGDQWGWSFVKGPANFEKRSCHSRVREVRYTLVSHKIGKDGDDIMLKEGTPFPAFSLPNQDGKTVSLGDFAGKWLVVYVYPKDDTPGCTIQGKSFTATKADFDAAGIAVVGVSQDDVASHKNFCNKFGFTIDLLADTGATLLKAAGVGQSEYKGTMYWDRTSFVIDPRGTLRKVYENVKPDGHEQVLLQDIKRLQSQ
jgi:peroxiredoxin Q/BCP